MDWHDHGVILSVRRHGETSAIAEILTATRGRCLGLVRGGRSRTQRPVLQPGNEVACHWRARLEDHLGNFTLDPIALRAGTLIDDPFALAGLSSLVALAQLLPEREPHPRLFAAARLVIGAMENPGVWPALYARWELGLLDELGFGLDLAKCAVSGATDGLIFVSPKTGRAVGAEAGHPWRDRLLPLPPFLGDPRAPTAASDVAGALRLTGFFLERHLFAARGTAAPERRETIVRMLTKQGQPHG